MRRAPGLEAPWVLAPRPRWRARGAPCVGRGRYIYSRTRRRPGDAPRGERASPRASGHSDAIRTRHPRCAKRRACAHGVAAATTHEQRRTAWGSAATAVEIETARACADVSARGPVCLPASVRSLPLWRVRPSVYFGASSLGADGQLNPANVTDAYEGRTRGKDRSSRGCRSCSKGLRSWYTDMRALGA